MYILDIETKPDDNLRHLAVIKADARLKDPEKIAADIAEKTASADKGLACDSDFNRIVCVGVKVIGQPAHAFTFEEYVKWLKKPINPKEKKMRVPSQASLNGGMRMITFNGRNFDLPTIIKYGIKTGADLPYGVFLQALDKYKGNNHIDLMEKLSLVWGSHKSLDLYMQIYLGIEKKTKGEEFFRTATDEDLKTHCLEDLEYTEQLFKKFEKLFI